MEDNLYPPLREEALALGRVLKGRARKSSFRNSLLRSLIQWILFPKRSGHPSFSRAFNTTLALPLGDRDFLPHPLLREIEDSSPALRLLPRPFFFFMLFGLLFYGRGYFLPRIDAPEQVMRSDGFSSEALSPKSPCAEDTPFRFSPLPFRLFRQRVPEKNFPKILGEGPLP